MAPIEKAIRAAGANAGAAIAGAGAVAMWLAENDDPQHYAATLSIVTRDWCAKAWRDGAPRAELEALRAAARYARQVHLRLKRCARDRPLAIWQAVERTRKGFCRPIPGPAPAGRFTRKLRPYRVAQTQAKWDDRLSFACYVETAPGPRGWGLHRLGRRAA